MIQSRRFCRRVVNSYTRRIVAMFAWGVEHDLVLETTWRALKVVKALPKGHHGTFDKEERQPVPVIQISLYFEGFCKNGGNGNGGNHLQNQRRH